MIPEEVIRKAMNDAIREKCQPCDWEFNDGFGWGFMEGVEWAIKQMSNNN